MSVTDDLAELDARVAALEARFATDSVPGDSPDSPPADVPAAVMVDVRAVIARLRERSANCRATARKSLAPLWRERFNGRADAFDDAADELAVLHDLD